MATAPILTLSPPKQRTHQPHRPRRPRVEPEPDGGRDLAGWLRFEIRRLRRTRQAHCVLLSAYVECFLREVEELTGPGERVAPREVDLRNPDLAVSTADLKRRVNLLSRIKPHDRVWAHQARELATIPDSVSLEACRQILWDRDEARLSSTK